MSGRPRIGRVAAAVLVALLVLGAGPAASGILVDAAGHPVAHATLTFILDPGGLLSRAQVFARQNGSMPKVTILGRAKTDAAGRFTLAAFPKGGGLVVVRKQGRVVGALHLNPGTGTTRHLALAKGKTLGGLVTGTGHKPIVGATVTVGAAFFDLPPVKTGADGRFTVTVPALPMPFIAVLGGKGVVAGRMILRPGVNNHLTVGTGRPVTGIVRENGKPVAGAQVSVGMMNYRVRTTTGKDGRFTLPSVAEGPVGMPMHAHARLGDAVGGAKIDAGAHPKPVTIDLVAPGKLRVTVLDADGHPVPGAKVTVGKKTAIAGSDGVAVVADLVQGPVLVKATAPGHGQVTVQRTVHGAVTQATVKLPSGGALTVHVVGLSARDGRYALVAVDPIGKHSFAKPERQVKIGAGGIATVPSLPEGRYVVGLIDTNGPKPFPVRVQIPRSRPVRLRVPRARPLAGRVLDRHRRPVAGVQVVARRVGDGLPPGHGSLAEIAYATTDARGRYRIAGIGRGHYRVTAGGKAPYPTTRPVTIRAGRRYLVLRVRRGLAISGVVCDPDGNPVVGASVQATRLGLRPGTAPPFGAFGRADVDAKGHFVVTPLAPGRYALDAVFDRAHVGHLRVRAGAKDLTIVVDTGG